MSEAGKEPVPEVSKRVEEGLLAKQLVMAREKCRPQMEEFVACSNQYGLSVIWKCRPLRDELNVCLKPHTSRDVLDQMKRDYVASRRRE